jgi:putative addiction module component (TIGR02574 family)
MSATVEQIEKQVLALPAEERAQLVDKLWESLGDTSYPTLTEEWKIEIEWRRRELLDGSVRPVPGEDVSRKAWQLAREEKP